MKYTKYFYLDTGRNEPCPCGSGKKFKKCCLDKPFESLPELENDLTLGQEMVNEFDKTVDKSEVKPKLSIRSMALIGGALNLSNY